MRRMYPEGEITVEGKWAPGNMRCRQVSRAELEREVERLSTGYVLRTTGATRFLAKELLGDDPGKQLVKLHELMHAGHQAWLKTEAVAIRRVKERLKLDAKAIGKVWDGKMPSLLRMQGLIGDNVTIDEMEALVRVFDPTPDKLASIDLKEITLEAPAATDDEAFTSTDSSTIDKDLVDTLMARKYDKDTAEEIAAIVSATTDDMLGDHLAQVPALKLGNGEPNVSKIKVIIKIAQQHQKTAAAKG
jgi:hypothetical protein